MIVLLVRSDIKSFDAVGCECLKLLRVFVCNDLGSGDLEGYAVEVEISEEAGLS